MTDRQLSEPRAAAVAALVHLRPMAGMDARHRDQVAALHQGGAAKDLGPSYASDFLTAHLC